MINRRNVIYGAVGLGALATTAKSDGITVSRSGTAFGTTVRLTVTATSSLKANAALDEGYAAIRAVHAAASLFDTNSELARFNAGEQLLAPSPVLRHLALLSDRLWLETGGAFDATVQPLWSAWQRAMQDQRQPQPFEIAAALANVGWQGLDIMGLPVGPRHITFNGIAQGYAADLVMAAFLGHDVTSGFADTGEIGICTGEAMPNSRLAIRDPRGNGNALGHIDVASGFVATSGDYATAFTPDFSHHHIFDPASGQSPADLASVTVTAQSGALADGLATAFMVMGLKKSQTYIASHENIAALLITKNDKIHVAGNLRYHT